MVVWDVRIVKFYGYKNSSSSKEDAEGSCSFVYLGKSQPPTPNPSTAADESRSPPKQRRLELGALSPK